MQIIFIASSFSVTWERQVVGWIKDCGFAGLIGIEIKDSRKFSIMVRR